MFLNRHVCIENAREGKIGQNKVPSMHDIILLREELTCGTLHDRHKREAPHTRTLRGWRKRQTTIQ